MRSDRRRHVRFEVAPGTVAVLTAKGKEFMRVGSVSDVSEGGVAFLYDYRAMPPESSLRLHLFGPNHSHFAVPGLPCKIIFDMFIPVTPSIVPRRICSVAFDNLSHRERVMLRECIRRLKLAPLSQVLPEQTPRSMDLHIVNIETGDEREQNVRLGTPKQMPRILIVDDEVVLVEVTSRILKRHGYRVITKTCPKEALEVLRSRPGEVDLIITDYQMPLMTGAEFAQEVLRTRPEVPIILYSGYSKVMTDHRARDLGFTKLAVKPLDRESLINLVQSVLNQDKPGMRAEATSISG